LKKKLKAKSFIIDGKAKSQKRKFYHTAFQLCPSTETGSDVITPKLSFVFSSNLLHQ